jgi:hypothetical protein
MNNNMENLEMCSKRVCNIYNKCSEEVQIDFIKSLFIKNKIPIDDLIIYNIYTIKELLKWGCINNSSLCNYVLNHKDVLLDNDFYYLLEKLADKNKELVYTITHHRIKDTYQNNSSSESESNYDDTSDFLESSDNSSIFSSDLDQDDNNDIDNIKYGKDINPEDVIDVD